MAVPKRRMSRANTHARRSQWKASVPQLMACPNKACGQPTVLVGVRAVREGELDQLGVELHSQDLTERRLGGLLGMGAGDRHVRRAGLRPG